MGNYHLASPDQQFNAFPQRAPDYMQQLPYNHSPYPQPAVDNGIYQQPMYSPQQYTNYPIQLENYSSPQNYSPNVFPTMNQHHSPQNMVGYPPMQSNLPTNPQKRIGGGTVITTQRPKYDLNEEQKQGKSLFRRWKDVRFAGIEVGLYSFCLFYFILFYCLFYSMNY